MPHERMALLELIEKDADADLIRELLAYASERLMATEVDQLTGAVAGAQSPERVNYRNGYRERGWETRVGRPFSPAWARPTSYRLCGQPSSLPHPPAALCRSASA